MVWVGEATTVAYAPHQRPASVTDFQSKVTRRPRSRLERIVSTLETRGASAPKARVAAGQGASQGASDSAREARREELLRVVDAGAQLTPDVLRARLVAAGLADRAIQDELLLRAGKLATVAPTEHALRVVVRLGYPGDTYDAVARALDAELPGSDALGVATRAHGLLDAFGRAICHEVGPACDECCVAAGCGFRGAGQDPAVRLRAKVNRAP